MKQEVNHLQFWYQFQNKFETNRFVSTSLIADGDNKVETIYKHDVSIK
jgi:hypothetical protein